MSGNPHFFCENCGTEVPRKAAKCPGCGRYFSSVRCPKCGFAGAEQLFADGCPVCGYSTERTGPGAPRRNVDGQRERRPPAAQGAGKLPVWVYLATLLAAAAVVAGAFFVLR